MADEILELCKECGIEDLAVESGLITNGEIPAFKNYEPMTPPNKIQGHDPKRRFEESSPSESSSKKRSKGSRNSAEKANKGLRHFSLKVCQKVEQKKLTTYNEVAEELVGEFSVSDGIKIVNNSATDQNIRRRVYDALNVLMALGIITKEKKEIKWIGLPQNSKEEVRELENEKQKKIEQIQNKREHLSELFQQYLLYRDLVQRNSKPEYSCIPEEDKVTIPFIVIHTPESTHIDCEIADDRSQYVFNLDQVYEIHDENEILSRMFGDVISEMHTKQDFSQLPEDGQQLLLNLQNISSAAAAAIAAASTDLSNTSLLSPSSSVANYSSILNSSLGSPGLSSPGSATKSTFVSNPIFESTALFVDSHCHPLPVTTTTYNIGRSGSTTFSDANKLSVTSSTATSPSMTSASNQLDIFPTPYENFFSGFPSSPSKIFLGTALDPSLSPSKNLNRSPNTTTTTTTTSTTTTTANHSHLLH